MRFFSSPILFEMFVLAEMDLKRCGYPASGSLEFALLLEDTYLTLGGKISYASRVSRILAEDDQAVGVALGNGNIHQADLIISAADGRMSLFELLEGKYLDKKTAQCYESIKLNASLVQVALGVSRAFEDTLSTTWFHPGVGK